MLPTGGTITTATIDGKDYRIHTFAEDGVFVVAAPLDVEYFLVGGGGRGATIAQEGQRGCGAAGGKVVHNLDGDLLAVPAGLHPVRLALAPPLAMASTAEMAEIAQYSASPPLVARAGRGLPVVAIRVVSAAISVAWRRRKPRRPLVAAAPAMGRMVVPASGRLAAMAAMAAITIRMATRAISAAAAALAAPRPAQAARDRGPDRGARDFCNGHPRSATRIGHRGQPAGGRVCMAAGRYRPRRAAPRRV